MVSFVSSDESKREEVKRIDRKRALKWVLLVTVPRTVLDATASLRTASVRQDQRQYFVLRFASAGSKGSPLECEPATHSVLRFASAGSKGSPLECEPATHSVLRFASAGSKGSTKGGKNWILWH